MPSPKLLLPDLPDLPPSQVSSKLPKRKDEDLRRIKTFEYMTVERSMKYEKDGTPVTLVPSTPEFVFTLEGGAVIIPHMDAKIYYVRNPTEKPSYISMWEIIDTWKRGGNYNQYLKGFINFKDTDTYTVLVTVSENPMGGGQRRKTRNYKKKYSRKVSSSSRKYKTRRLPIKFHSSGAALSTR